MFPASSITPDPDDSVTITIKALARAPIAEVWPAWSNPATSCSGRSNCLETDQFGEEDNGLPQLEVWRVVKTVRAGN